MLRKDRRWTTFFIAFVVLLAIEVAKFFVAVWFNTPWLMYTPITVVFWFFEDVLGIDPSDVIGHLPPSPIDPLAGITLWIILTIVEILILWYYTGWYTFLALPIVLVHIPPIFSYFTIVLTFIGSLPWVFLPIVARKTVVTFQGG